MALGAAAERVEVARATVVGPAADAFGVDATLIAAGVLGGAITLAFMFYPGARGPERDGSIEAIRAEGSEVPAPV